MMKTELSQEDRGKVWRAIDPPWLFYAYRLHHWRMFPVDPRENPTVMSIPAHQTEGKIIRHSGFIEVE